MTRASYRREVQAIRGRTRRAVGVSVVAHAVLLALLLVIRGPASDTEGLTEITWIDVEEAEPPPAPAPAARVPREAPERAESGRPAPTASRVQFTRQEPEAQVEPDPQELAAAHDRMRERLRSLQEQASDRHTQVLAAAAPVAVPRPRPAGLPPMDDPRRERTELTRGEVPPAPAPVELTRSTPAPARPLPAPSRIREKVREPTPMQPRPTSGVSRELLAGVTLSGPVADRRLVSSSMPEYPEWAKAQAVEGSVRLYFEVLPDGKVKENVFVQKTSGFEDFDRNATRALLAWHFEPLGRGQVDEQWGSITLNYRLSGTSPN